MPDSIPRRLAAALIKGCHNDAPAILTKQDGVLRICAWEAGHVSQVNRYPGSVPTEDLCGKLPLLPIQLVVTSLHVWNESFDGVSNPDASTGSARTISVVRT
jgi:hypothetical protein